MNTSPGLPRPGDAPRVGMRRWAALAGAGAFTALSLALSLALPVTAAAAATATATFGVSANVQATCVIGVTDLAFGTYTGVVNNNTATVTVTCTNTTTYTVGLSPGLGTGATVTARHMMNAAVLLNYSLSQTADHATNWGNTPGTDTPISATATGAPITTTVYGQVAAGQYVAPGTYTDTVTATVNF